MKLVQRVFLTVALTMMLQQYAAAEADCSNLVAIGDLAGVLYKPENLHGARGPTFLVQNAAERTKKRKIEVRDVKCRLISKFGLYSTDWPYGARYYQKSGGGSHSASQLTKLAKLAGSTNILVEGVKGKWIVVQSPMSREGEVFAP